MCVCAQGAPRSLTVPLQALQDPVTSGGGGGTSDDTVCVLLGLWRTVCGAGGRAKSGG